MQKPDHGVLCKAEQGSIFAGIHRKPDKATVIDYDHDACHFQMEPFLYETDILSQQAHGAPRATAN